MINYIKVNGTERNIDFDAHYKVDGHKGISFYLLGWFAEHELNHIYDEDDNNGFELELEPNYNYVVAVMVGDDRKHKVAIEDIELLGEEEFCRSCGQIGCGCNVYA
jgi:hypothetical protein